MSKISAQTLDAAIEAILKHSKGDGKRNFLESIELQVALKNYDIKKEKRFSGALQLPTTPRPKFSVCLLGNERHCDEAKEKGIPYMTVADLEKLKKNKKLVKKLAQSYGAFIASSDLIKKIPRLLGPGLNKAGKFPTVVGSGDSLDAKVEEVRANAKFQLKSKNSLTVGVAVANVEMTPEQIRTNVILSSNFLVSLLKKNWQNIRRLYLKSTMGPVQKIYGY